MTEAFFGLAGVLLGGLISGGATYFMRRREERQARMAAARLMEEELFRAVIVLYLVRAAFSTGRRNEMTKSLQECAKLSTGSWLEHRATLARILPSAHWDGIIQAYFTIGEARRNAATWLEDLEQQPPPSEELRSLAGQVGDYERTVDWARQTLSQLTGRPERTGPTVLGGRPWDVA